MNENKIIISWGEFDDFSNNISKISGFKKIVLDTKNFNDGEFFARLTESVRDKDVYILKSASFPINKNLMEILIVIDALRRASSKSINVVIPYLCYSRQDRESHGKEPITAKLIANILTTAGASKIITFDLHSDQVQGFYDIPFNNIKYIKVLAHEFAKEEFKDLIIVSPDYGSLKRAKEAADILKMPITILDKTRYKDGNVSINGMIGEEVSGKNCVIFDDMVDTGKTISNATKFLKESGANKIYLVATHAVLSSDDKNNDYNKTLTKLFDSGIDLFFTSNTIIHSYNDERVIVSDISSLVSKLIEGELKGTLYEKYLKVN